MHGALSCQNQSMASSTTEIHRTRVGAVASIQTSMSSNQEKENDETKMIPYKWRVLVEDFPLPCLIISTLTNKCKEHMPLCHIILTLHMTSPEIVDVERILGLACWFRKISITELSWILLKTFHKLVSIPRSSIFWFIMEQQVQAWRCCVSPWVGGATCPDRGRQVRQNKRARREAVLEENFLVRWWTQFQWTVRGYISPCW